MPLDVDYVRSQYHVYQQPELADWAFFENAGGSYVPAQVTGRLDTFFQCYKVQPYGPFTSSVIAGEAMDAGYRCMVELLNARDEEVTIGPSTTLNCYVLAQAMRPGLKAGDEVIVTNQDHEANIGCWERLSEFGAVVRRWQVDPATGELDPNELSKLVTDRTRIVCFSLCSNIVGTFQDAKAVTEIAHRVGAVAIADGVSFAPHRIVDVNELGADIYLFSTYKTFGTHLGVMWIKDDVQSQLACQGHYFNRAKPRYRLNPTGPLHAEIAALAGIGEYFDVLYRHHFDESGLSRNERTRRLFGLIAAHETDLANQLLDVLRELPDVRIIGQRHAVADRRAPTISFVPGRMKPSELAGRLAAHKIAARNGHFYALRCIEALGIDEPEEGVLRVSLVHYNTPDEVERLSDALRELLG